MSRWLAMIACALLAQPAYAVPQSNEVKTLGRTVRFRLLTQQEIATLSTHLQQHPHDISSRLTLARAYELHGSFERAAAEYEKAMPDSPTDAYPLVLYSELLFRSASSRTAAERVANAALSNYGNNLPVLVEMALFLHDHNEPDAAYKLYWQASKINPPAPELMMAQACYLAGKHRFAEALAELDKVSTNDRTRDLALPLRLRCLISLGRQSEALKLLDEMQQKTTTRAEVLIPYAWLLSHYDRTEQSFEVALRALAFSTTDSQLGTAKSIVLKTFKKLPPAASTRIMGTVALSLHNPARRAAFEFALADVLDHDGRTEQAMQHIEKGLLYSPENCDAHLRLGHDLQMHKRDLEAAYPHYLSASHLAPFNDQLARQYERCARNLENYHNNLAHRLKVLLRGKKG